MVTVHRYLVTGDDAQRVDAWTSTAMFANWIEGRENGDRETWIVTCFDENSASFLEAVKTAGATAEEIEGAGETETYKLLIGEPGSGWAPIAERATGNGT